MSETIQVPESRISRQDWHWLVYNRNKGRSSLVMFSHIVLGMNYFKDHPLDWEDFQRCLDLMRILPETKDKINMMSEVSTTWEKFVERWQDICHLIKTNNLMEADELIQRIAQE